MCKSQVDAKCTDTVHSSQASEEADGSYGNTDQYTDTCHCNCCNYIWLRIYQFTHAETVDGFKIREGELW